MPTAYFKFRRRRGQSVSIHGNVSKNPRGKLYDKIQNELFRRRKLFKELESMETPKRENVIPTSAHIIEDKGRLRNNYPLNAVKEKWRLTRNLKICEGSAKTPFVDFLNERPLLRDSTL